MPLLILFLLFAGPVPFLLLSVVVAALGLYEFFAMAIPGQPNRERVLLSIAGAFCAGLFGYVHAAPVLLALMLLFLLTAAHFLFRFRDIRQVSGHLGLCCLGYFYVPLLLGHLIWLRHLEHGVHWIFLVLVVVMMGDSAAYFTGSAFGRTKLYPSVSPNKSIEGSLGGLAGSLIGGAAFALLFMPSLSLVAAVPVSLLLGALGQVGDLFESLLKRSFGVKDSGSLIPGHGGILDRLDSLLFAFAPAYYLAVLIV